MPPVVLYLWMGYHEVFPFHVSLSPGVVLLQVFNRQPCGWDIIGEVPLCQTIFDASHFFPIFHWCFSLYFFYCFLFFQFQPKNIPKINPKWDYSVSWKDFNSIAEIIYFVFGFFIVHLVFNFLILNHFFIKTNWK